MRRLLIILCLLLAISCQKDRAKQNLPLSEDIMVDIVYDMQKAKAVVAIIKDTLATSEIRLQSYRNDVFAKYNIKQSDFDSTWNYYLVTPDAMDSLLKKVERTYKKIK